MNSRWTCWLLRQSGENWQRPQRLANSTGLSNRKRLVVRSVIVNQVRKAYSVLGFRPPNYGCPKAGFPAELVSGVRPHRETSPRHNQNRKTFTGTTASHAGVPSSNASRPSTSDAAWAARCQGHDEDQPSLDMANGVSWMYLHKIPCLQVEAAALLASPGSSTTGPCSLPGLVQIPLMNWIE